ncbi:probable E3 ubiquitin-protein ligase HERC4 [Diadema setosum]|uniref:probable E3 ubiquitin-protein ligase HERC4 n=1 Tax=Diadema setosum TaxID=31175 RepID=UPI003B3B06BB
MGNMFMYFIDMTDADEDDGVESDTSDRVRDAVNKLSLLELTSDPSPEFKAELEDALSPHVLGKAFSRQVPCSSEVRLTFSKLVDPAHLKMAHLLSGNFQQVAAIIKKRYRYVGSMLCQAGPRDHARLRSLPLILECTAFDLVNESWSRQIVVLIAEIINELVEKGPASFQRLVNWWKNDKNLLQRLVCVFREGIRGLRKSREYTEINTLFVLVEALGHLNKVNEDAQCIIPRRLFYLTDIPDDELIRHLALHCHIEMDRDSGRHVTETFTWMKYPFLLSVPAKWFLLSDMLRKHQDTLEVDALSRNFFKAFSQNMLFGQPDPHLFREEPICLNFSDVRRGRDIIHSALQNVDRCWAAGSATWLLPLRVNFQNEYALDFGGPRKEFFQELFKELMDTSRMSVFRKFSGSGNSSFLWFNAEYKELDTIKKIGFLFALMVYNRAIITVPFPVLLYEKLLNQKSLCFEDFSGLDARLLKNLCELREYSADVLEATALSFAGIKPGGDVIPVTPDNLEEYIQQKAMSYLAVDQFEAFCQGFNMIERPPILSIFQPEEFCDVILGERLDWESLENSTRYELPYHPQHPVIRRFWNVFHQLDEDDKRRYLKFLTGSDHVPVGGFESLKFTIKWMNAQERHGDPPERVCPEVMTCPGYISMDLPEYESEADTRSRLLKAIEMCSTFHREMPQ